MTTIRPTRRGKDRFLLLALLGVTAILLGLTTLAMAPRVAADPTPTEPDPTAATALPTSPTPTQPTPTRTTVEPSRLTESATNQPTGSDVPATATARPTPTGSPTPTSSPTPAPARSATPAPTVVTLPPIPPAATTSSLNLADIVTALAVLALTAVLLWRLTRTPASGAATAAGPFPVGTPPTGPEPYQSVPAGTVPTGTVLAGTGRAADEDDVLALLAATGEALTDAGFDVNDVQSELHGIAVANGLPDVEIVAMPTVLVVSTRGGAGMRTGAVTTGHERLLLHQIEALDDIVRQSRQGLDPRQALRRIHALRTSPPPFGPAGQLLGGVLASVALAVLLDSSWVGLIISGLLGALVGAVLLVGQRLPARYQPVLAVVAASAVSLTVLLLAQLGFDNDVVPTLIAPLIMLLPGALLTTAVIELATGQMISGAGRAAAGIMQLLLLGLGIVGPALLVGVPALDLTAGSPPLGALGPWLAVGVFGIGIVMNRCARPRSLGWILIVLYVAYGAQVLGSVLVGAMLSAFVGALAMSPVADLVARQRSGPPAIVSFTPAFWILVPGALGLMGVATLLSGDDAGQDTVLTTVVTMVVIALGVLVGRAVSTMLGLRSDRAG